MDQQNCHYETYLSSLLFLFTAALDVLITNNKKNQRSVRSSGSRNKGSTYNGKDDDDVLSVEEKLTVTPTTASEEEFHQVLALRKNYIPTSVSLSYVNTEPLMMLRGDGVYLYDHTGRAFLDTRNNVAHVGHSNDKVVNAVVEQVRLLNTNTRYLHPTMARLAEKLISKMPKGSGLCKVFFVNSGSEANDLALRLTQCMTKSKNMICIAGAYHGHTLSVLNVSPYKFQAGKRPIGQNKNIIMVPAPNGSMSERSILSVKEAVSNFCGPTNGNVGGIIMEGGMSVAGVILPPKTFYTDAIARVKEAGGLYIADEVQTGFGRFGNHYWGFEQNNPGISEGGINVFPDIITVGKPFGNGMPLGAVITTERIASVFDDNGVEYFNTFGGNPVSAAAGVATMDIIDDLNLQQNATEVGNYLKSKLLEIKEEVKPLIQDVRGRGLFIGIEFLGSKETSFLCSTLKDEYNILTSIDGPNDNVLVIKPPMIFSVKNAMQFCSSLHKVCRCVSTENLRNVSRTPT